jgi:hypothetical protein
VRDLFAWEVRYEGRAADAIDSAKRRWGNIEDIVMALEWAIIHDVQIGPVLNERGVRGFVYPGARSMNEPDVDVIYEDCNPVIVVHDLTFRDAKARYVGNA